MATSTTVQKNRTAALEFADAQLTAARESLVALERIFLEGDRAKLSLSMFTRRSQELQVSIEFYQRMQEILRSCTSLSMLIPNAMIVKDCFTVNPTLDAMLHGFTTEIIIKLVADV